MQIFSPLFWFFSTCDRCIAWFSYVSSS